LAELKQEFKKVPFIYQKEIEIPTSWDYCSLSELFEIKNGFSFKSEYFVSELNHIVLTPGNFNVKGGLYFEKRNSTGYMGPIEDEFILKNGDFLIVMTDITRHAAILGNAGILEHEKTILHNQRIAKAIFKKDVNKLFLYYIFNSKNYKKQIHRTAAGTTVIHSSPKKILSCLIPIPKEIVEQDKISTILSNIDELIQSHVKTIESTKKLKKGLMQQLLTKGFNHKKFKKTQLGRKFIVENIPEAWRTPNLEEIATVHGRIGWKNLRADEYVDSGPLMLSVWSLIDDAPYGVDYGVGVFRLSQFRYDESPEIQLQNGDVLIAKDGDIGRIGYVKELPERSTLNSHVVIIRKFDDDVNSEFLYWYAQSNAFQRYCVAFTSGTTVPLLSQKNLKRIIIPIPKKVKEQEKIASILSTVEHKILSLINRKTKLEYIKRDLIQKLLTGQIRV
jgi:type I restriction enzyme, S subunit